MTQNSISRQSKVAMSTANLKREKNCMLLPPISPFSTNTIDNSVQGYGYLHQSKTPQIKFMKAGTPLFVNKQTPISIQ